MGHKNYQGQIFLEVCVVMAFMVLIGFVAIGHLQELKQTRTQYKFTRGSDNVFSHSFKNKK